MTDGAYASVETTPTNKALLPFAPVRPRASATPAGIHISFLRRGRIDSDAWEPVEIPLGEESENYLVDVARSVGGPRRIAASTTSCLYPSSDIAADFGATPTTLDLTIRQVSASVGPGYPLVAHIPVQ